MMTAAFVLIVALCVTLPIALACGMRTFGWTATALGLLGLIHAAVIIAFDINGAPLSYRFAHSRLVLATGPVSIALLAAGVLSLGVNRCRKHRLTGGGGGLR